MTPEKAIKFFDEEIERLERVPIINGCEMTDDWKEQLEICKLAKSALEKQILKKPDLEGDGYDDNGNLIYDTGFCPNCNHEFEVDYDATKCCPECGQALDWSDSE